MLQFMGGDQAATTDMMDIDIEFDLISGYRELAYEDMDSVELFGCRGFFEGLSIELDQEFQELYGEWQEGGGVFFERLLDGTYNVLASFRQYHKALDRKDSFGENSTTEQAHSESCSLSTPASTHDGATHASSLDTC